MDSANKRALARLSVVLIAAWTAGCVLDGGALPKKTVKAHAVQPKAEGKVNILSVATAGVAPADAPWQARDVEVLNIARARVPPDGFSILAITETVKPCLGGGNTTYVVDNQAPPWFSQGDTYTTTYTNCIQGSETINGSRKFSIDKMVGQPYVDPVWSVATTMASKNLVRVSTVSGDSTSADGSATTTLSSDNTAYKQASKGSWTRIHPNNGAQQQWSASFDVVYAWDETAKTYTWDFNVSTTSSLFGNATAESLVQLAGTVDRSPETGKLKLTQHVADVTSITMITAQGAGNALLEIDSNGDGTFESSTVVPWSDLMIDPILYQFF